MGLRHLWGLLLLCPVLHADVAPARYEEGKPVEVRYDNGRVARWLLGRKPPIHLSAKFQISENTCTGIDGTKGKLRLAIQHQIMPIVWAEHEVPEKKGEPIKVKKKGTEGQFSELFALNFHFNANKKQLPIASAGLGKDFYEGDDFSWLPGGGGTPPDEVTFVRWDSESMFTNPETGVMENRTNGIAMHVHFKRDGNNLALEDVKHFTGNPFAFFNGDMWAIVLKVDDEFCQISQKANLGDLVVEVGMYLSQTPDWKPYLWGSDEYSKDQFPGFFKEYLDHPENFDVE